MRYAIVCLALLALAGLALAAVNVEWPSGSYGETGWDGPDAGGAADFSCAWYSPSADSIQWDGKTYYRAIFSDGKKGWSHDANGNGSVNDAFDERVVFEDTDGDGEADQAKAGIISAPYGSLPTYTRTG